MWIKEVNKHIKSNVKMFLKFILLHKIFMNILKVSNKCHVRLISSSFTLIKHSVKWRNLWQTGSISTTSVKKLLFDHLNNYTMILIISQVFYNAVDFFKYIMSLNFVMCFHNESHLLAGGLLCVTAIIHKEFLDWDAFMITMSVTSLDISFKMLRTYTGAITTFFMWKAEFIDHPWLI